MLLMKILYLTMQTGKNLQRILERKTRKILLRRLKTETPMQLFLLLLEVKDKVKQWLFQWRCKRHDIVAIFGG
jgi:hypothetical protein